MSTLFDWTGLPARLYASDEDGVGLPKGVFGTPVFHRKRCLWFNHIKNVILFEKLHTYDMSDVDFENNQEEWKEKWDNSYLKAIAAFYNTDGGRMVVGRRDDGTFVGLSDPKGDAKKISDTIHNKLHINVNVCIESLESKDCVVIEVSPGKRMVDLDGQFYVRVGNTNQTLEGEELRTALLGEKGMDWLDQTCDYTIDDLSADAISFFIKQGKKRGRISETVDPADIEGVLSSYELSADDKLTMTAVMAFGQKPRRLNDGAYLVIGEFDSRNILRRETYVEVPGIQIVDEAIHILYERYIPPKFEYEGRTGLRIDAYDYPEDAVRELIVNALVHKDYSIQEPTRVAVYPDHLEISSMGLLPKGWTLETLYKKHISSRRNRALANIFHDAGYVEKWGQGIEKVIDACKENGNPSPEFSFVTGALMATLPIRRKITRPSIPIDVPLVGLDYEIVVRMKSNPKITKAELSSELGVSDSTVSRHIEYLLNNGYIVREGSKKAGSWIILSK